MKCFVTEASIIFLLCFVELFKVVSSDGMDIIDNFIGLAEPNNTEIEKRNSIVDGGVFVPYKSTTIVYKSRLVPVTYGFVIKKETLKDNPALYKLGVKLLDEQVESTPEHIKVDGKKIEQTEILTNNLSKLNDQKQQLEAKSNCVKSSKVLKLLAKLSKDINKIEKEILAQNESVGSKQDELIAKSFKKKSKKLHPQSEVHVSGHKGVFEKQLNIPNKKPHTQYISKNLSSYWHCRRSHTKKKCAMLLFAKHVHSVHQTRDPPERRVTSHHYKHKRLRQGHEHRKKQHLNKHNGKKKRGSRVGKYNNESTKHLYKHGKKKNKLRLVSEGKNQNRHNNDSTIHQGRQVVSKA